MRSRIALLAAALATALATMTAVVTVATPASAATLTQVTNFGTNPTNLNMYLYVPDRVARPPGAAGPGALLRAASARRCLQRQRHDYAPLADRYGFIVDLPEATRSGNCFDVSSPQALRRDGGSDPIGIMSMVGYARAALQRRPGPDRRQRLLLRRHDDQRPGRATTRTSSAPARRSPACPPDASPPPTAPSGTASAPAATSSTPPQQWGDLARALYPGYTGRYPRMQMWHGTTDTTLAYPNFGEEIKQWTNLHGV